MSRKVSDITKDLIKLEEKRQAILNLLQQQIDLVKKIRRTLNYPKPKRDSTTFKRIIKMHSYYFTILALQNQIKMISWQPIFPQGGLPIVGEMILNKYNE